MSLEVPDGKIVGLIGPNGAGKTTLVDAIAGFVACDGRVEIAGQDVTRLKPHARVRRGLGRTWQAVELFDDLSVAENVAVAIGTPSPWATVKELFIKPTLDKARVGGVLDSVGIGHLFEAMPTELSEGQRKLVGIARAFAGSPRVVCLDEPAAGLDTSETRALGLQLRGLTSGGTSMLLIDHDIGFVFGTCDHVVVVEFGEVIAEGPPHEIYANERVIEAYLGSSALRTNDPGGPS
ncbi:MAG: ATP-binding cassette domain-containing protein [Actinomycetota bacterium]|nr:ATP-binding cassette domain-containing protein [Actinomycetota bacterium]